MSIRVNVCMSKFMRMPIELGVCMYAKYANVERCLEPVEPHPYKRGHRFLLT